MTSPGSSAFRPGRVFVLLWAFTFLAQIVSLQVRLAVFGGTSWLSFVKFTSFADRLGFVLAIALLCAALCGFWVGGWAFAGKIAKGGGEKLARWCATSWIVLVAVDLLFRHRISAFLGNAFNFLEFASGVGGVWRMLVQAFGWYGDVIVLSVLGVAAFSALVFFVARWFLKPGNRVPLLDKIPARAIAWLAIPSFLFAILLMSIWAHVFPGAHKVLASETMVGGVFNGIVRFGTDVDGDGYGAFDLPPDTMPFDGNMHPYALDIPDDGTDQDLLLGDLEIARVPQPLKKRIENMGKPETRSHAERRHVIIVLMESVREDMLDARVDGKPVMPELSGFVAQGALRHDKAFATRGFTQNSVTQTFWGGYFDPGHTLVDDFRALGYHTAVFSGESLLDEGFDESCGWNRAGDTLVDPRFVAANTAHHETVPARMLMDEVESFLDQYDVSQPLFMHVFYQDPHFPYQQDNPPVLVDREIRRTEISATTRPRLWRTYANQVYHLDMAAGRLINALRDKHMLDNSLVLFVSDHGESLFDDGYLLGHGVAIQDRMTQLSMVVWGARHDLPSPMSHVDIRSFVHADLATPPRQPRILDTDLPVLQFIGATSVPSAISHRFGDGSRVTYEFATNTAWRETSLASFDGQRPRMSLPQHGDDPVSAKIEVSELLKPTGSMISPIRDPLENPQIQALIREWEYLQWLHRK